MLNNKNNNKINPKHNINFDNKNRLAKHLSILGIASKRDAEKLITDGKVKVNGILCNELLTFVSYDDEILVNGKIIKNKPIQTKIYIMNKPKGCITSNNDPQGRKTIFELIPDKFGRLISIGRLDFNTEGLILLTNNGELARLMEMPASQIKRVYFAKVIGEINDDVLQKIKNLKNGIKIEGIEYGKIIVDIKDFSKTKATFRITIFEGKNNEIRRIMWFFGLKVVKLTRVQYGDFKLQGLPSGCIQESRIRIDLRRFERRINDNIKRYNKKKGVCKNNINNNVENNTYLHKCIKHINEDKKQDENSISDQSFKNKIDLNTGENNNIKNQQNTEGEINNNNFNEK